MKTHKDVAGVLLVTGTATTEKFFRSLLPKSRFDPVMRVGSAAEARRILLSVDLDIVLIYTPLPDDFGLNFAIDLKQNHQDLGVMMVVRNDQYEQISYVASEFGVMTLNETFAEDMVQQCATLLMINRKKIKELEKEAQTLKEKMEDIKVVNRAKILLVSQLKMTEQEAHRFIEKSAMDRCIKRKTVAENIIRTYEN